MKSAEEILSEFSKNYGMIKNRPRATVKGSEAIDAMKEYAKQLLSDYTDKIVENVAIDTINMGASEFQTVVDKESITSQLEPFLKTIL